MGLGSVAFFKSNQFNSAWGRASLQGFSPAPSLTSRLGAPGASVTSALPPT